MTKTSLTKAYFLGYEKRRVSHKERERVCGGGGGGGVILQEVNRSSLKRNKKQQIKFGINTV
jgi:hypothetical protein